MAAGGATSTLPASFYDNFGITKEQFDKAFLGQGNGTFRLKPGWTLGFTHAVLTTGDHPTTVQSGQPAVRGNSAGDLWSKCTGSSVTKQKCCVLNCSNKKCRGDPQQARATAHVYATFQLSRHDIRYMILLPTCSACNNCKQCESCKTNFPPKGQQAKILYTLPEAQVIFVEVDDSTVGKKGGAGKGTGKGGHIQMPQGDPSDAPPCTHIAGQEVSAEEAAEKETENGETEVTHRLRSPRGAHIAGQK